MGILYHFLQQCYNLRYPPVVKPIKRLGFFRRRQAVIPSSFMSNLHEATKGHALTHKHAALFRIIRTYFLNLLFFHTQTLKPQKQRRQTFTSFKAFKLIYRVLDQPVKPHFAVFNSHIFTNWSPQMFEYFQYLFVAKYLTTPFALLDISVRSGRHVSLLELSLALSLSLNQSSPVLKASTLKWVRPEYSEDFVRLVYNSPRVVGSVGPSPQKPLLSITQASYREPTFQAPLSANTLSSVLEPTHSTSATFHKYVTPVASADLSLVSPTRGFLNKLYNKGRTPRNKQIYRTGVFWCLWLTVLTVLGPFYVFYGFSFAYTHLYIFPLAILFRAGCVAIARFYNITLRQLWLSLISLL